MYEIGCTINNLRQSSPQYSPAIMPRCTGWGGGATRCPCTSVTLHQSALTPPMLSAALKAQLICFAPPQECRALPDIRVFLMSHRYVLHAMAAHKLIAHTVASPLLVVVSFNTVIYLPRGWSAWMEDLVVSEDMFLFTVLMTKLAKRTKCFFPRLFSKPGCTSD